MKTKTTGGALGLPIQQIDAFLGRLRTARYSEVTVYKKRRVLSAFSRWMADKNITMAQLGEPDLSAFVERRRDAPAARVQFELSVVRSFYAYLRGGPIMHLPPTDEASMIDKIHRDYVQYLTQDRGLAKNSVLVYAPRIRDFLASQDAGDGNLLPDAFDAITIRNHVLAYSKGRSGEYIRLMAVALRSFCHFLFLRGATPRDQCDVVPVVKKWRQSSVPTFLTPEQEEALIASADRTTPRGRRDYAVLLLLARLGLRASEIVALELDDIRWRSGELVIHGKGKMVERVPLLSDVGEAVATYLHDRGTSTSRRIFLRLYAPSIGLAGPAAIGHIVRLAFVRAGFRPPCRGAAHLFRHGLATMMIRHGASMAEIAEVLRHRTQDSTAIYAKVAFDDLRGVARPWPTTGGT